jgi:hypothetical protein
VFLLLRQRESFFPRSLLATVSFLWGNTPRCSSKIHSVFCKGIALEWSLLIILGTEIESSSGVAFQSKRVKPIGRRCVSIPRDLFWLGLAASICRIFLSLNEALKCKQMVNWFEVKKMRMRPFRSCRTTVTTYSILSLLLGGVIGHGQEVASGTEFVAEQLTRIDPVASEAIAENVQMSDSPEALAKTWDENLESLFRYGSVDLKPHFAYRLQHNDNIFSGNGVTEVDDIIHEVSPGLKLESISGGTSGIGGYPLHFEADYTPTFRYFQETTAQNNIDQTASIIVNQPFQRLGLSATFDFLETENPFIEAGNRSAKTIYIGGLSAIYELGGKTDLEMGLHGEVRNFEGLIDTKEWKNMDWINYGVTEKTEMALGGGLGYTEVGGNSNFITEDLQGRIRYVPTAKLASTLSGGVQWRQFQDVVGDDSKLSPIVQGDLTWYALDNTLLLLQGGHRVAASNFVLANIEDTTSFSATIRQRVMQKVDINLTGGLGFVDSEGFGATASVGSRDYNFYQITGAYSLVTRGKVSVFYRNQDRSGNAQVNASVVNVIGLDLSYQF